jgi:hypothetical protein
MLTVHAMLVYLVYNMPPLCVVVCTPSLGTSNKISVKTSLAEELSTIFAPNNRVPAQPTQRKDNEVSWFGYRSVVFESYETFEYTYTP